MKITIDFDENILKPALQEHLETGKPMQEYISNAVSFYNECRSIEKAGHALGYGKEEYIKKYNIFISTTSLL